MKNDKPPKQFSVLVEWLTIVVLFIYCSIVLVYFKKSDIQYPQDPGLEMLKKDTSTEQTIDELRK